MIEIISEYLLSLIALIVVLVVAANYFIFKRKITAQWHDTNLMMQHQETLLLEIQSLVVNLQQSHNTQDVKLENFKIENEQVSKQLEHRIKTLRNEFSTQLQVIDNLLHQQPADKLYSRAQKYVELGADIDEIIKECEIPRAEAEMLLAVHRKNIENKQ